MPNLPITLALIAIAFSGAAFTMLAWETFR